MIRPVEAGEPVRERPVKILCLTDYRGAKNILPLLARMVPMEQPDIIFYCGGSMKGNRRITEYLTARKFHSKPSMDGSPIQQEMRHDMEHVQQFILALADTHKTVYVVPGMCDAPESFYLKTLYDYVSIYPNLRSAHEMIQREETFVVAGFGGDLSHGEDDREFLLQYATQWPIFMMRHLEYLQGDKILLFHSPPVCRLDQGEEERVGVILINELIERVAPKLLVCGMAEKGQGTVKLGETIVVNPGPLHQGHYALVEYPSLDIRFENLLSLPDEE
jgi:Icc-related predicted phosphoesterase